MTYLIRLFFVLVFVVVAFSSSASAEEYVSYLLKKGETVSGVAYRYTLSAYNWPKLVVINPRTSKPFDNPPYERLWVGTEVRVSTDLVKTREYMADNVSVKMICDGFENPRCARVVARLNNIIDMDVPFSGVLFVPKTYKTVVGAESILTTVTSSSNSSVEVRAEQSPSSVGQEPVASAVTSQFLVAADETVGQRTASTGASAAAQQADIIVAMARDLNVSELPRWTPEKVPRPPDPTIVPGWVLTVVLAIAAYKAAWLLLLVPALVAVALFGRATAKQRVEARDFGRRFAQAFVEPHNTHRLPGTKPMKWKVRPKIRGSGVRVKISSNGHRFPSVNDDDLREVVELALTETDGCFSVRKMTPPLWGNGVNIDLRRAS